ncbi:hypothetical protein IE4771_PB00223 (plasmid) [Rhizobium etli bv. mimosae str. IE4771]|uniref:Uncharacterized protein n=1 Tax=Rhizobium etli bv. mimosae str. IE4771 TaxID=1432050 RepID=A0A060I4A4_RHIET|nr:hypothetical protein IE4771_PB00223 [Rhizobium sp. IE4771]
MLKAKLREDRQWLSDQMICGRWTSCTDQVATRKKLRVLTVVDAISNYVPVLDPNHSYQILSVEMVGRESRSA